jgi:LacI family transcriptional regulator
MMGIGALRAAAERGIGVPQHCSIIGFDDIELGRLTYPALSTVGQSVRALGDMAAQTLIERIAGTVSGSVRAPGRRRVVSPRLIVRESTATWAGAGQHGLAA